MRSYVLGTFSWGGGRVSPLSTQPWKPFLSECPQQQVKAVCATGDISLAASGSASSALLHFERVIVSNSSLAKGRGPPYAYRSLAQAFQGLSTTSGRKSEGVGSRHRQEDANDSAKASVNRWHACWPQALHCLGEVALKAKPGTPVLEARQKEPRRSLVGAGDAGDVQGAFVRIQL
eukprot:scaffold47_cov258-Pinguiococcus_pyrenoidosus.AAC.62